MRDPADVAIIAGRLFCLSLGPGDSRWDASFATYVFKSGGIAQLIHKSRVSMAYVARYLKQPITWVERLTAVELRAWGEAVHEIVKAENGKGGDGDTGGGGHWLPTPDPDDDDHSG